MNLSQWLLALCRANIQSIAVWAILSTHALLLARIAYINAPVFDEIAHLPAGLSHWQFGNFDLYRVNPPLMRMIAAIPLLVANPQTDWTSISDDPYARPEFIVGSNFMKANGYESFWLFTICRWAQIPVSVFGGWICFGWAKELYGTASGFLALILWCFCPNILAWGATITPDAGAAAFGLAAAYQFWRWLKTPTWTSALLAGTAIGLAQLTKSTWIILFALWPILWIGWRISSRTSQGPKAGIRQLGVILLAALYFLNLGYGFENSFQRLDKFNFISQSLGGPDAHTRPGNRFRNTWLAVLPVPVPANYLIGIDVQRYDFEKGKWSYLRGEQKLGGWYHYYLYASLIKTPVGTLCLIALAIWLWIRHGPAVSIRDEVLLLVPAVAIFVFVSSQTGFNRYLRYVLPAFPFIYIFAARTGQLLRQKRQASTLVCGVSLVASVCASMWVFPHSMSFFNSTAGGPIGGPWHLLDANIDWGQDLLELKRFVDHHPDVSPLKLKYFGVADPKLADFRYEVFDGSGNDEPLPPGWYAISVNHIYGYKHYDSDQPNCVRFRDFVSHARAGYSIYLYQIVPGATNAAGQSQD